jgi:hypothetical protein
MTDEYTKMSELCSSGCFEFLRYKIPGDPKSEGKEYTWYAVLVWVGRKPSPKFNATKALLTTSQYFQNQSLTYSQLAQDFTARQEDVGARRTSVVSFKEDHKLDDCMRVGEASAN